MVFISSLVRGARSRLLITTFSVLREETLHQGRKYSPDTADSELVVEVNVVDEPVVGWKRSARQPLLAAAAACDAVQAAADRWRRYRRGTSDGHVEGTACWVSASD